LYASSYLSHRLQYSRRKILMLVCLVLFQILIGVSVIHSKLHFSATALHLGVALLILSVTLYLWFQEMVGEEGKTERAESLLTYNKGFQEMRGEEEQV
ncbi:MAG TPA: hypothetical protein VLB01_06985, partial [Thermodesulfobacteriota bacterium]|nr:hypothetical protein [Thermodesulfobacteriota bacterium]